MEVFTSYYSPSIYSTNMVLISVYLFDMLCFVRACIVTRRQTPTDRSLHFVPESFWIEARLGVIGGWVL